jgi:hypothetical protein
MSTTYLPSGLTCTETKYEGKPAEDLMHMLPPHKPLYDHRSSSKNIIRKKD